MLQRKFVGRETELNLIQRELVNVQQDNSSRLINIYGIQGIGKTLLLEEIKLKYHGSGDTIVTSVDFDSGYTTIRRIRDQIAHQIGDTSFDSYFRASEAEKDAEIQQDRFPALFGFAREESTKEFTKCFNNLTNSKSFILSFDTCEKIIDTSLFEPFLSWLTGLDQTLVVLAGYRNHEIQDRLAIRFGSDIVLNYHLDAFKNEDFLQFLQEFPVFNELSNDHIQSLEYLTDKKPLLIHLSALWLDQHLELPKLIKIPLNSKCICFSFSVTFTRHSFSPVSVL